MADMHSRPKRFRQHHQIGNSNKSAELSRHCIRFHVGDRRHDAVEGQDAPSSPQGASAKYLSPFGNKISSSTMHHVHNIFLHGTMVATLEHGLAEGGHLSTSICRGYMISAQAPPVALQRPVQTGCSTPPISK